MKTRLVSEKARARLAEMMNFLAERAEIDIQKLIGAEGVYMLRVSWPGFPKNECFQSRAASQTEAEHIAKLLVQGVMWAAKVAFEQTGELYTGGGGVISHEDGEENAEG